ncbi:MAG: nuclear pore complex subunit [Bacteroidetes bacterium]|nr:MAG: nuclear pore complex subunit [Bacteroidota bacterium]
MEKLVIEATPNTPGIVLDPVEGKFSFSGESRPENVRKFYLPVLEWLESYTAELKASDKPAKGMEFHFSFEYFNSTSSKFILDIFKLISQLNEAGLEPGVHWYYEEDDEDMLEVGEEMSRMSKLPFSFIVTED